MKVISLACFTNGITGPSAAVGATAIDDESSTNSSFCGRYVIQASVPEVGAILAELAENKVPDYGTLEGLLAAFRDWYLRVRGNMVVIAHYNHVEVARLFIDLCQRGLLRPAEVPHVYDLSSMLQLAGWDELNLSECIVENGLQVVPFNVQRGEELIHKCASIDAVYRFLRRTSPH